MRKYLLLALAFPLLVGCVSLPDDWSEKDQMRMNAVYAAIAADAVVTSRIRDNSTVAIEGGPLASRVLGPYPKEAETLVYMAAMALAYRTLARKLPPKWRRVVQYVGIGDHVRGVKETCDKGIC